MVWLGCCGCGNFEVQIRLCKGSNPLRGGTQDCVDLQLRGPVVRNLEVARSEVGGWDGLGISSSVWFLSVVLLREVLYLS